MSPASQLAAASCPANAPEPPASQTRVRRQPLSAHDTPSLRAGLVLLVPELRGRALRLSGNTALADDIVQDTIERALRFEGQYEPGTNLRAWVFQILFSVFITRYRRLRRERNALRILSTDPCAWTIPPANGSPEHEVKLTTSTQEKLAALPDGFRSVIVMVDLEERSYREAAVALGLPLGTVMSRLHRGRKLLAAQLAA